LLSATGQVKLADFGSALILSGDDYDVDTDGGIVGTAEYVSPEALRDEKVVSGAPDIWALGCVVYKLLRGRSPFLADTEYLTFRAIKQHCEKVAPVQFNAIFDEVSIDFILKLLDPVGSQRLGCGGLNDDGEVALMQNHPFFAHIVWDDVINMKAPTDELSSSISSEKEV
jgi:serine/threonine protein kinase